MRVVATVCVDVLPMPGAYAFASEAGSVMLPIRVCVCLCALVCVSIPPGRLDGVQW